MYKLTPTDDTPLFSAEALVKLAALPRAVLSVLNLGAAFERTHHRYRNRTGNLQRSTAGSLMRSSPTDIRGELAMGMPYASYIVKMGLSEINQAARSVEEELTEMLETYFIPKF